VAALAIMSIAVLGLMRVFSAALTTTRQAGEQTVGLMHATALVEESLAMGELESMSEPFGFDDGYRAVRTVSVLPPADDEEEARGIVRYEIVVHVSWPPEGDGVSLSAVRVMHAPE
jgi:Tfp pilus assembly protein PilV